MRGNSTQSKEFEILVDELKTYKNNKKNDHAVYVLYYHNRTKFPIPYMIIPSDAAMPWMVREFLYCLPNQCVAETLHIQLVMKNGGTGESEILKPPSESSLRITNPPILKNLRTIEDIVSDIGGVDPMVVTTQIIA